MPNDELKLSDFDYDLPKELIAQCPLVQRDHSKLMVLNREEKTITHHQFFELPNLLDESSVLVFNESRVIPARLTFQQGNGNVEVLLIKPIGDDRWECMVRPGKKFNPDTTIEIDEKCTLQVINITPHGLRTIQFKCNDFNTWLRENGHTPTPPYIHEYDGDPERYQTIYSKTEGSVAAPTAGFHFTEDVFSALKAKKIQTEFVTLHVGLGTFQSVKTDNIKEHQMHSEWFSLSEETAERLNKAKSEGKKIVAVGTTAVRVLETCAALPNYDEGGQSIVRRNAHQNGTLTPQTGETSIFIYPGYQWKFVDSLITNFHVPKSTLLMLVSSLARREFVLKAYETAKKQSYRFFSFGDSMLIK